MSNWTFYENNNSHQALKLFVKRNQKAKEPIFSTFEVSKELLDRTQETTISNYKKLDITIYKELLQL